MTNKEHKESYVARGGNSVIMFVHGILGTPNEFDKFMPYIENDVSILNVLLPGHGGDGEMYAKANMEEWKTCVKEKLEFLRDNYERIILVGHSMGTLLLLNEVAKNDDKIVGMFLLAVPLYMHVGFKAVKYSSKIALNINCENDNITKSAMKAYSVQNKKMITYFKWLDKFIDLLKLGKETRGVIGKLKIKGTVIMSKKDELVRIKSRDLFVSNNFDVTTLENSTHFYYDEGDFKILIERFKEFLKNFQVLLIEK